jgi:hypothetical protein
VWQILFEMELIHAKSIASLGTEKLIPLGYSASLSLSTE